MGSLTGYERRQRAVYWAKTGVDTYNRPIVTTPIELRVRWVDKEEETLSSQNTVVRSDVTLITDRELEIGSVLWKGKLKDVPSPFSGQLYQVILTRNVPGLKNKENETRHSALLIRYSTTLPTVS